MTTFRAQVTIPVDTMLPEDVITNTFHFEGESIPFSGSTDAIMAQLTTFYQAIDNSLFPPSIGNTLTVKIYDLADPIPRVPVRTGTIAVVPSGGNALPHEVAIAISFKATPQAGDVASRKRGRIFLGPCAVDVSDNTIGKPPHIDNGFVDVLAAAAKALQNAGTVEAQWVVYSPTTHHGRPATPAGSPAVPAGTLGEATANVGVVWVDNAFDTIRSRGLKASYRKTLA